MWGGGKSSDNIKGLPIAIRLSCHRPDPRGSLLCQTRDDVYGLSEAWPVRVGSGGNPVRHPRFQPDRSPVYLGDHRDVISLDCEVKMGYNKDARKSMREVRI